ncbi:2670_t:CDS:10, partial [Acaulospora morrowiae]
QNINSQELRSSQDAMDILPTENNESQTYSKDEDGNESRTGSRNVDDIESQANSKNNDAVESQENSKNGDIIEFQVSSKDESQASTKNDDSNESQANLKINGSNESHDALKNDTNSEPQENTSNHVTNKSQTGSKTGDNNGNVISYKSRLIAQPIVNINKVLFRCFRCYLGMHQQCLPPLNNEKTIEDKMKFYRRKWTCHFCHKWEYNIDKILTFRYTSTKGKDNDDSLMEIDNLLLFDEFNAYFEVEFLVKFEDLSYRNVEWVPGPWLMGVAPAKFRNFIKSEPEPLPVETVIHSDWTKVDRVLDVEYEDGKTLRDLLNSMTSKKKSKKSSGKTKIKSALIKWKGIKYSDANWEDISDLENTKFKNALQIRINAYNIEPVDDDIRDTVFVEIKKQPKYLENPKRTREPFSKSNPNPKYENKLKEYQLDGFNWLRHNWCNGTSCILADDMGLGKTVQVICLIMYLYKEKGRHPFIVVAPKSTTAGWVREFKRWAHELVVVEFHGEGDSCQLIADYELFPDNDNLKCHVVVTTAEAIANYSSLFSRVPLWEVLIVDEAHSLKAGETTQLFRNLNKKLNVYFKVLLTGTPLMNKIDELFNLLNFLGHKEFSDPKKLAEEYQGLPSAEQLPALHKLLKRYFLRRTKNQVDLGLPPMDDVIVRVSMSPIQKRIYKETFEKNAEFLRQVAKSRNRSTGFSNILMTLRQIVSHPYLINREQENLSNEERQKMLVESSGKLILLKDMLKKLYETGHKVLIFSQFLDMLSILEEFCEDNSYLYTKLDGSTSHEMRQKNISAFQAPDSKIFIFLLSTRAGGVGLNLMAADTVFILDPDFNPHQDLQALSRIHRIGQNKPVKVFRFVTQFSVEERIVEKGKLKLARTELVVEKMDDEVLDIDEVDDIIRCGVQALFSENSNEKPVGVYTEEAIEKLLDRSQMRVEKEAPDANSLTGFAFARVWDNENQAIVEDETRIENRAEGSETKDFWVKLLAHVDTASKIEENQLGKGARNRKKIDYYEGDHSASRKPRGKKKITLDPDFVPVEVVETPTPSSSSDEVGDEGLDDKQNVAKARVKKIKVNGENEIVLDLPKSQSEPIGPKLGSSLTNSIQPVQNGYAYTGGAPYSSNTQPPSQNLSFPNGNRRLMPNPINSSIAANLRNKIMSANLIDPNVAVGHNSSNITANLKNLTIAGNLNSGIPANRNSGIAAVVNQNTATNVNPNIITNVNPNIITNVNPNIITNINPNITTNVSSNIATNINPSIAVNLNSSLSSNLNNLSIEANLDKSNGATYLVSGDITSKIPDSGENTGKPANLTNILPRPVGIDVSQASRSTPLFKSYYPQERNVDKSRGLIPEQNSARYINSQNGASPQWKSNNTFSQQRSNHPLYAKNTGANGPSKNSILEPLVIISDDEQTTRITPTSKQGAINPKREELINKYKNWFDQLQLSGEDLVKRLRALNRVDRELRRLEFDVEGYIAERDLQNKLDRELINEYRSLLRHIGAKIDRI